MVKFTPLLVSKWRVNIHASIQISEAIQTEPQVLTSSMSCSYRLYTVLLIRQLFMLFVCKHTLNLIFEGDNERMTSF